MQLFVFITLAVAYVCLPLSSVHAAKFECDDEPAACKTKFVAQFGEDFKELHLKAMREMMTTFLEIGNSMKSDLSIDSQHYGAINRSTNTVSGCLQQLDDNLNDDELTDVLLDAMDGMSLDYGRASDKYFFRELPKADDLKKAHADIQRQMFGDIRKLWVEMYAGLRQKDLTTYREYDEVNGAMNRLRGPVDYKDFTDVVIVLDMRLRFPYMEVLLNLI